MHYPKIFAGAGNCAGQPPASTGKNCVVDSMRAEG